MRSFCRIEGEKLVGIDLKSSQPYLLASKIVIEYPNEPEAKAFFEIVTNQDIYQWFLKKYTNRFNVNYYFANVENKKTKRWKRVKVMIQDREYAKEEFLKVLFKGNGGEKTPFQKILKDEFPFIYKYISDAKKVKKEQLAINLQKLESNVFMSAYKVVCKNDIKALTVHDSIYCKEKDHNDVRRILNSTFSNLGYNNYTLK